MRGYLEFFKKIILIILRILNYKPICIVILFWFTLSFVNTYTLPQNKIQSFFLLNFYSFEKLFTYWLGFIAMCWIFYSLRTTGFIKSQKTLWKFVKF